MIINPPGLSKFKHDTIGKFHLIKMMVENIEKGAIAHSQGFMAIHELVVKMNFISKEQTRGHTQNVLILTSKNKTLAQLIGEELLTNLKQTKVSGVLLLAVSVNGQQFYILPEYDASEVKFILGKLITALPISEILIDEVMEGLINILDREKVSLNVIASRMHYIERLKETLCTLS